MKIFVWTTVRVSKAVNKEGVCKIPWISGQKDECLTKIFNVVAAWCLSFKINSLRPSDAIWRHKSGSTLAQVWLAAWRHQAITWTNVDLSSVRSSGIHQRAISWEIPQPPFTQVSLKITFLKLNWNLPGLIYKWFAIFSTQGNMPHWKPCQPLMANHGIQNREESSIFITAM